MARVFELAQRKDKTAYVEWLKQPQPRAAAEFRVVPGQGEQMKVEIPPPPSVHERIRAAGIRPGTLEHMSATQSRKSFAGHPALLERLKSQPRLIAEEER
jgi:hypothetical protein